MPFPSTKNEFYSYFTLYLFSNGHISPSTSNDLSIILYIITPSDVEIIKSFFPFEARYENHNIEWVGVDALEILHQLVINVLPVERDTPEYENVIHRYNEWLYENNGKQICRMFKTDERAIIPFKHRVSDVGYDLTIIEIVKQYGSKTIMFDTFIKVQSPIGYYTKIVPRSSLIKSGYILTNSVGIIDGGYTNTLKICLTKIDDSVPALTLPFTCCQLILEKLNHYEIEVCEQDFGNTSRGLGGFGSTNKQ